MEGATAERSHPGCSTEHLVEEEIRGQQEVYGLHHRQAGRVEFPFGILLEVERCGSAPNAHFVAFKSRMVHSTSVGCDHIILLHWLTRLYAEPCSPGPTVLMFRSTVIGFLGVTTGY